MSRVSRVNEFRYVAGPILIPLVVFWRELLGLTVFAGFDFTHLILPFQQFARESVYAGSLPEWNPYLFAGFPQLAEGEGGFFYPGNLLFFLPLDQSLLLSWTVIIHFILAGLLMYGFLRSRGASGSTASWLSVFYQLIPGMILRAETVGLFEAVAWIPGLYWALERAVLSGVYGKKFSWLKWLMFASACVSMMLLAGSSQIAFYTMVGAFFYLGGLCLLGQKVQRLVGWGAASLFLTGIFALLLSAVQLIPTMLFSQLSYRLNYADYGYYEIGTWLNFPRLASLFIFPAVNDPAEILNYVSSLGYIGFLPFLLVGIALSVHKRYMNPILAPFMLVFFGMILSFGLNIALNQGLITFPGFNLFRALGRMTLPTIVGLFALAAVGLDRLFEYGVSDTGRKEIHSGTLASIIVAVLLVVWFIVYEGLPLNGLAQIGLLAASGAAVVILVFALYFLRSRQRRLIPALLAIWLVAQVVSIYPLESLITMYTEDYHSQIEKLMLNGQVRTNDPMRPARMLVAYETELWDPLIARLNTWPIGPGRTLPIPAFGNEPTMMNVGVVNAYTPLVTDRWYTVAHEYAASGLNQEGISEVSPRLGRILAITGTDVIVVPGTFTGGEGFTEVPGDFTGIFPEGWHMLNVPEPHVPYVSIPEYVEAWSGSDWEYFKHWIGEEGYVPGEWVSVEIGENSPLAEGMEWEEILTEEERMASPFPQWASMENDPTVQREIRGVRGVAGKFGIIVYVNSQDACWVVIRESIMPGWEASIDGTPAGIYAADLLFMAVPVPTGEHTLELSYTTPGLSQGMWISGIWWVVWLLLILISLKKARKE